ncbi:MAG: ABC transporter ATP-binding protein [Thermoleophilia bacterium]|nr:ABC transporter ATP-binding protein [Thermoleophilia bacterium]
MTGAQTIDGSAAGILEFDGVTKRFSGMSRPAVDDFTLTVPAGKVVVLIGPSGCGKTTAMKMVNRLVEPSAGEIRIDGAGVRSRRPAELRREIGYVIQQVGLMPHLTVAGNVATVPRLLKWDSEKIRARVDELLDLIGLAPAEYRDRYPAQLSGGQQQRVGLARALAGDPPVMLMDEPFSAVDPITRERLQNDFLRLHRVVPKTVVFVSHDIDEAVKMADLIAVMREGRLVQYAPAAELLASPVDDFVADFVGADRALKALGISHVEAIGLRPAPMVTAGERGAAALARLVEGDLQPIDDEVLVVDSGRRPLDWLPIDRIRGDEPLPAAPLGRADPVVDQVTTLRDALSALLGASASHAVVVDGSGAVLGVLALEDIVTQAASSVRAETAGADA